MYPCDTFTFTVLVACVSQSEKNIVWWTGVGWGKYWKYFYDSFSDIMMAKICHACLFLHHASQCDEVLSVPCLSDKSAQPLTCCPLWEETPPRHYPREEPALPCLGLVSVRDMQLWGCSWYHGGGWRASMVTNGAMNMFSVDCTRLKGT